MESELEKRNKLRAEKLRHLVEALRLQSLQKDGDTASPLGLLEAVKILPPSIQLFSLTAMSCRAPVSRESN